MNKLSAWLTHVSDYPIMMAVGNPPQQFIVHNEDQLLHNIYLNLTKDIYVSVHIVGKRENNIFDKLYFDIDKLKDDVDLFPAFCDMLKFHYWLEEKGYEHRVYFSGSKGFNIYIDFEETVIEDYSDRMEAFIEHIKYQLGIERMDLGVCKDTRRISRLPFSINTKTGKMCVPIDVDRISFSDLSNFLATDFEVNVNRVCYPSWKKSFVKSYLKFQYEKKIFVPKNQTSFSDTGTSLDFILKNAKSIPSGARHNAIWKIIIPAMIVLNYTDEEIMATCKQYMLDAFGLVQWSDIAWITSQMRMCKSKGIFPMRLERFRFEYNWSI